MLKLTREGSDKIAGTKSLKPIQSHGKLLERKVEECHEIKARVQKLKVERGEEEVDIRAWGTGIEKSLEKYERAVEGPEELERSLRERETREFQDWEEERERWEIKKKLTRSIIFSIILEDSAVRPVHGWTDSAVALHWIAGKGNCKQFVLNRVAQIDAKDYIQRGHVSSSQKPALWFRSF